MAEIHTVLILLMLLQVKHMFADFFLQTPKMLSGRSQYLHMGRIQHAFVHAVGSSVALVVLGASSGFILLICVLEGLVHFHIDWLKGKHAEAKGHGPAEGAYWRAFGVDQLAHQLTYVAMIWAYSAFGV